MSSSNSIRNATAPAAAAAVTLAVAAAADMVQQGRMKHYRSDGQ